MLRKSLILCLLVFCSFSIYAQNKVLDKPWIKENTPTRRVIPYTHVREADVMWQRRVWRTIDLREKINHPLYYPITPIQDRKCLYDVLKEGILEGTITAYDVNDDEFTIQLTKAEAKTQMGEWKENKQYDEWGEEILGASDSVYNDFSAQDIVEYRLKEEWFFDRERSIMDVRILGIAPVRNNIDENTGESKGKMPMFWVYFPEARYVFANYDVFNRQNDAERRTFEDIFWKRMFNSYIVKRSNVYDRNNKSYLKGLDLLLEGDKIKEDIFNYEHDLWHF
ncbi:gliding motility protein GldN [Vicingus serpentipes]|uniref:Gliding motility protein GldN n=1 Tax=Vicingus serpentipes TaxID=1926625 RepID=A0A5C6RRA1_9FLAO|nr:gliding motility protein GldN [Vicingus serpentipes]TXB63912.1 gliding motility protein GldN [Vicingus serpentipes]